MKIEKDLRMYILVNEDVKISKGKLAGQVGHAVAAMFYNQYKLTGELLPVTVEYMSSFQKKIILYAPEEKLLEFEKEGYIAIRDKGWTQLKPNTLTCVNLGIFNFNHFPVEFEFIKDLKLV